MAICASTGVTSSASPSMNWISRVGGSYVFVSYTIHSDSAWRTNTMRFWLMAVAAAAAAPSSASVHELESSRTDVCAAVDEAEARRQRGHSLSLEKAWCSTPNANSCSFHYTCHAASSSSATGPAGSLRSPQPGHNADSTLGPAVGLFAGLSSGRASN